MSVELELKQRLNLQKGDEVIFVREIWKQKVKLGADFGLARSDKCQMDNQVIVKRQSGKMGIYTINGEVILPEDDHECQPEIYDDGEWHHEVIHVKKDGLKGVYSYDGKKEIVPKGPFESILLTSWGIKVSQDMTYYKAYSYGGKQIFAQEILYEEEVIHHDQSAFICINKNRQHGVYSKEGKEIIPFKNHTIRYKSPFFKVVNVDIKTTELYTFDGDRLPLDEATNFQWIDNLKSPIFNNCHQLIDNFILAFKDDKRSALYTYAGKKVVPNLYQYNKMYLEKEYIICIGNDGVSMDVYDFEGNKIFEYKP